jgi:hypothetical protein
MRAVGRIVPRANGSFPSGEGRQASVSWAGIFVEGRRRPAELMGLTRYQQTVSADIGNLGPGHHTVRVKAVDCDERGELRLGVHHRLDSAQRSAFKEGTLGFFPPRASEKASCRQPSE